jgi:hypothetical protein
VNPGRAPAPTSTAGAGQKSFGLGDRDPSYLLEVGARCEAVSKLCDYAAAGRVENNVALEGSAALIAAASRWVEIGRLESWAS